MRIAFDVVGTIDGPHQEKILRLFKLFEENGHEMFVWSTEYSYTVEAIEKHKLNAQPMCKYTGSEMEESGMPLMDIAIDDDQSQYRLGTRRFIYVHNIPDNIDRWFINMFM